MGGREETIELGSDILDLWRVRAGLRVKLKRQGNLGGSSSKLTGARGNKARPKHPRRLQSQGTIGEKKEDQNEELLVSILPRYQSLRSSLAAAAAAAPLLPSLPSSPPPQPSQLLSTPVGPEPPESQPSSAPRALHLHLLHTHNLDSPQPRNPAYQTRPHRRASTSSPAHPTQSSRPRAGLFFSRRPRGVKRLRLRLAAWCDGPRGTDLEARESSGLAGGAAGHIEGYAEISFRFLLRWKKGRPGFRRGSSSEGEVCRRGFWGEVRGWEDYGCVGGCVEAEGQACGVRLAHSGLLQRAL